MAAAIKNYVDFDIADIVLNGVQTKDKLKFSIWQGNISINIVPDGEFRSKLKKNISRELLFAITTEMQKLRGMGPESMIPITVSKWNNEARKFETDYVLKLSKDDKLIYTLEIISTDASAKFIFRGGAGITIGSEPMSEPAKSALQFQSVYEFLTKEALLLSSISRRKWDPNTSGGNNNNRPAANNSSKPADNDAPSEFF